ncbi:DUF6888 family protein [Synechocystis sp. CS-94]|uniref:DUF6888 family protein n=1 Tax=Synechocystis sp. CS-94 TaxID=2847986 RepID=UPI00056F3D72
MPSPEQVLRCFQLCQNLTNMYLSIDLVRFDQRTENVVIIAGEETLIEIYSNGNWRFINEN